MDNREPSGRNIVPVLSMVDGEIVFGATTYGGCLCPTRKVGSPRNPVSRAELARFEEIVAAGETDE